MLTPKVGMYYVSTYNGEISKIVKTSFEEEYQLGKDGPTKKVLYLYYDIPSVTKFDGKYQMFRHYAEGDPVFATLLEAKKASKLIKEDKLKTQIHALQQQLSEHSASLAKLRGK
jgi:hypothetical protein